MKSAFSLFLLLLTFQILPAQIINGSFENWELNEFFDAPSDWETNQDSLYQRILKDTLRTEGNYSLKTIKGPPTAWQDCPSRATLKFGIADTSLEGQSLFFDVKIKSLNEFSDAHAQVELLMLFRNVFAYHEEWETYSELDDFTTIELKFTSNLIDSIVIYISGGATNGATDGCNNESTVWVDNFRIDDSSTVGVKESSAEAVFLYPNPSEGIVYLETDEKPFTNFLLMDSMGRSIRSGTIESQQLEIEASGIYFIRLHNSQTGEFVVQNIVVQQ